MVHELFPYLHVTDGAAAPRPGNPKGRPLLGHAELDFGGTTLMLSDEYPEMDILGPRPDAPTCVSLHLHVDNADTVIARAVALGATLERAAQDAFYGERSGVVRDPFGHRQGVPSFISPRESLQRGAVQGALSAA